MFDSAGSVPLRNKQCCYRTVESIKRRFLMKCSPKVDQMDSSTSSFSLYFQQSDGFMFLLIVQCCYRTVGLINKNVAVDQVASRRAASDAPLAGYPWRIGSLCSVKRAFFFSPFQVYV